MNRIARITLITPVIVAVALGGCASTLSGVGGTQSYACKAPVGAQCTSISGVYANASRGMSDVPPPPQTAPAPVSAAAPASSAASQTLRSSPRVLRLWIAPWEDADGDLHDASFVHVVVDTGRWLIDRVRPAARSRLDVASPPLAPLTPPTASAPSTPEAGHSPAPDVAPEDR